jgi:hypothetical protein
MDAPAGETRRDVVVGRVAEAPRPTQTSDQAYAAADRPRIAGVRDGDAEPARRRPGAASAAHALGSDDQ